MVKVPIPARIIASSTISHTSRIVPSDTVEYFQHRVARRISSSARAFKMTTNGTSVPATVSLHGRTYRLPQQPTVVICVDGFDPTYLQAGIEDGITPTLATFVHHGFHRTARSAMPSLTNPNNLSITTGMPTAWHGVGGNYYVDTKTGEEHMITDASLVMGNTILAELADAGVRVAAITAKDKLRKILCHGLSVKIGSICFSAQCARDATFEEHGIVNVEAWLGQPQPPQYSGDLSLFVLDAGLKLLQEGKADFFYLTLSDYIQHKYAPREPEADAFMKELDKRMAAFIELGAVVAVTGDHGMSDKSKQNGEPNVLFIEDLLSKRWPQFGARVICPIADPFVLHHGALGGYVRVHFMEQKPSIEELSRVIEFMESIPEVEQALSGEEASFRFQTPVDKEGDLVIVSVKNAALGARADKHDLLPLKDHRLRSHGGLSEQGTPILRSEPLKGTVKEKDMWRNFDVFDVALNYWWRDLKSGI